ncbi:Resolvase [Cronobacter dublinensis 582]|nr:Resolvase [Cronobacter dublinensis 582]
MTMINYPALPSQAASLPVAIDYPAALALRQMAMVHEELPRYLLAPEVSALLHYVPDLHRKMLLATLWNTGARINEALALTRADFSLTSSLPFVQLATLKQLPESARKGLLQPSRPVNDYSLPRSWSFCWSSLPNPALKSQWIMDT